MNGIEILSTAEVVVETVSNDKLAIFVWFGIAILGAMLGWIACRTTGTYVGLLIGIVIGFFAFIMITIYTATPIAYTNEYKVTISDEVSLNEFMDKYEIIDQEGKIYTVRERE